MTSSSLAATYKNLAELYDAGINIVTLFETLASTERDQKVKQQIFMVSSLIKRGKSLADSMAAAKYLPTFDIPVVQAGERSGTLLKIFNSLAKKYEVRAQAERTIRAGLLRPIMLLGAGLFILPFPDLFTGKISAAQYLITSGGIMAAFLLFIYFLFRFNRLAAFDLGLAELRHNIFLLIPGVRGIIQKISLENFVSSFAHLLDAGLPMYEALDLSARSTPDKSLRDAAKRILLAIKSGGSLPDAFGREPRFGLQIHAAVVLGTQSGKLPVLLHRQALELKRQVVESIERVSKILPALVYAIIAIYIGKQIIGFYTQQMKGLDKLLNL